MKENGMEGIAQKKRRGRRRRIAPTGFPQVACERLLSKDTKHQLTV